MEFIIGPELAARVEAELTGLEETAVATAKPAAYVHEVVTSCRESGRSVAVVSNNSERAVNSYLAQHGLDDRIDLVVARTSHDAALLKPSPHLIEKALAALDAEPATCAFVGDSTTDIEAARLAGVLSIGYAKGPGSTPYWPKQEQTPWSAASQTSSSYSEPAHCRTDALLHQERRLRRRWPGTSVGPLALKAPADARRALDAGHH